MAVKIRLTRMGKIRAPFYRVVVADSRTRRDGRAIEEIGQYDPTKQPSHIVIDSERAQYWLSVGAQPTDQVKALLKVTGDWQKFTGVGDTSNRVKPQPEKEEFVPPEPVSVLRNDTPAKGKGKGSQADAEESAESTADDSQE